MYKRLIVLAFAGLASITSAATAADNYTLDPAHAGANFKIAHLGLSYIYGRFNNISGNFSIDESDPAKSSFEVTIKTESIDTANQQRDNHLRSPDFFNVKQFPTISFKSASVKAIDGGYEVTGDLTMHGQTKPITFKLMGGKKAELPKGVHRTGFATDLTLKRSEFGMDKFIQASSDEVAISISFEGILKK